jgi:hypothetical protein
VKIRSRRSDELSRLLQDARPEAPDELVDRLLATIASAPRRRRPLRRLAPALALTGAMVVALAAVGGLSYGATLAADVVHSVTRHATYLGSRMPLAAQVAQVHNAALDQYGGGGSSGGGSSSGGGGSSGGDGGGSSGGGGGGGGSNSGGSSGGGANSGGSSTQTSGTTTASPTTGGAVTVHPASDNSTGSAGSDSSASSIAVAWSAGTFSTPTVVTVDSKPPTAAPITGSAQAIVSIVVTNPSTGQPVHDLASPMTVTFEPPTGGFPRGYIPLISSDGVAWRATAELQSPTLPSGQADGFYRWTAADGAAHPAGTLLILTRHLTLFAVLFSSNAAVSESGRKTPQAGSGLFGDPTRSHTGAPILKQVGTMPTVIAATGSLYVPVSFSVDEQTILHLSVFGPNQEPELILPKGSAMSRRASPLAGLPTHNLKVLVLRPGTITARIKLQPSQILPGRRYRLRLWAVDYDGHATVRYITFKG